MERQYPWDWVRLGQVRGKVLIGSTGEKERMDPGELGGCSMGKASLGWFTTLCTLGSRVL